MKPTKFVVLFIITCLIQACVVSAEDTTTCFETNEELKAAVDAYALDPSNATSAVALQYGWPIGNWCTDHVTDFSEVFSGLRNDNLLYLNEDISSWNTSSATTMYRMFYFALSFNQPLNGWNVSNVQNMSSMFYHAEGFNQPLNDWKVSNVQDMSAMFYWTNFFNQPLDGWDVSNVQDMSSMFYFSFSFNQPLNGWNVSNVQQIWTMLSNADSFNQPLNGWDLSNVQDMSYMFFLSRSFNQNLCEWGTSLRSDVTTEQMFRRSGCPKRRDPDLKGLFSIPRQVPSPLCHRCCRTFQLICRLRYPA